MNLLKKIKFNYHLGLIKDHIKNNQYNSAFKEIKKINQEDKLIFVEIIRNLNDQLNDQSSIDIYQQKNVWTISYDLNDLEYLNKFLNFYLSKNFSSNILIENFSDVLSELMENFDSINWSLDINFNHMVQNSGFYQNLLLFNSSNSLNVLSTCSAFFESQNKFYFIYPNPTICFFYIVQNPKDIFIRYKQKYQSSEASHEELLNNAKKLFLSDSQKNKKHKIYENRVNYQTNLKSWTDPNVINTYKGLIIEHDKLIEKTEDTLLDVIYHLKQHYPAINVAHNDVKTFIKENGSPKKMNGNLSNNELKFMKRNLLDEINLFSFL